MNKNNNIYRYDFAIFSKRITDNKQLMNIKWIKDNVRILFH